MSASAKSPRQLPRPPRTNNCRTRYHTTQGNQRDVSRDLRRPDLMNFFRRRPESPKHVQRKRGPQCPSSSRPHPPSFLLACPASLSQPCRPGSHERRWSSRRRPACVCGASGAGARASSTHKVLARAASTFARRCCTLAMRVGEQRVMCAPHEKPARPSSSHRTSTHTRT